MPIVHGTRRSAVLYPLGCRSPAAPLPPLAPAWWLGFLALDNRYRLEDSPRSIESENRASIDFLVDLWGRNCG
jgi:hypothetical protein